MTNPHDKNHYLMSASVLGITTADISIIRTSVNFFIGAPLLMIEVCSYAIQILILLSKGKKGWFVQFGLPCIVATQAPYT